MANILAGVFYILGAAGYMTYPVKYMETQFQKSAARANILAGNSVRSVHITVDMFENLT
jgi:Organic Anion Transporter Polypeptide (OATP) family.